MKLRPPAIPLINSDPYFNVWSATDELTASATVHWTNSPMQIRGIVEIDGKTYRFIGNGDEYPAIEQRSCDVAAFSTTYVFAAGGIELTAKFTTPNLPTDLYLVSRPVSYLEVSWVSKDNRRHAVAVKVAVSEEFCVDKAGQYPVIVEPMKIGKLTSVKLGSVVQEVLSKSGDDLRIDWGYLYLSCEGAEGGSENHDGVTYGYLQKRVDEKALFTFAYDDVRSIEYFGEQLKAYWRKNGEGIGRAISRAHGDYAKVIERCDKFSDRLIREATNCGGEKYADIVTLSLRQCIGAHKLVVDNDGEVLFISKECFSNGCAATVDVSYPSIPLFLIYNPELVRGMMRPIYKYATSEEWTFDFAPHDVGCYPKVNGQVYGENRLEKQMPVEECGNMLIMEAATALASGKDVSFAVSHIDLLEKWVSFLVEFGADPANQLCTDDFAGHLAHNCNLTLKAVMGIASYAIIKDLAGDAETGKKYMKLAKEMAASWQERAYNGDGSYRLAYNWQNSFSMKYNMVWDKLFGTGIFPTEVYKSEFASYKKHINNYGLPLDNRADYTKSDWLIWTGCMADSKAKFEAFIEPLWRAYDETESRVPMTDWYYTTTALHKDYRNGAKSFRNRTVVGGHFMKLLDSKKKVRVK